MPNQGKPPFTYFVAMSAAPTWIVLVAGGSGVRMGGEVPKQFMPLGGKPVILQTLYRMQNALPTARIMLVLPVAFQNLWLEIVDTYPKVAEVQVCIGGHTRFHSVQNALNAIPDDTGLVAIHDAVRPLVDIRMVRSAIDSAEKHGASVPVVPIRDSVRTMNDQGESRPLDRGLLRLVQTPQCFKIGAIKKAYNRPFDESFTDDASVWEADGGKISLVEGNEANLKITRPEDVIIAEALLAGGF